jgi:hypothetical protein
MGIDRCHQFDAEFANQGEIACVLFEHRIDQHPLATGHIRQQVGEGAGVGVEQLPKQQRASSGGGSEQWGSHGGSITCSYEHSRIMGQCSILELLGDRHGFATHGLHHGALALVVVAFVDQAPGFLEVQHLQAGQFLAQVGRFNQQLNDRGAARGQL